MPLKFLLLFLAAVFTENLVGANRVDRTHDDTDDMGPVFPFEAFGIGYEDFISKIHPPLISAMNYRPVMPHDISQLLSDRQITSAALSSNSAAVVELNEETATTPGTFTSSALEVLPTPIEEPGQESSSSTTPELKNSDRETLTETVEVNTEEREESIEDIHVEPESDSENEPDAETPVLQTDKASTSNDDSLLTSDKEAKSLDDKDHVSSKEKSSNLKDNLKDSSKEASANASRDKAASAVYDSEARSSSESLKTEKSQENQESLDVSSKESEIRKSDEESNSSSDDDYYYYANDYQYTESEVFESEQTVSGEEFITSSYEYSDSTSEYYSTELVQSEEKVFVFPETHIGNNDNLKSPNDENSEHGFDEDSKVQSDSDSKHILSTGSEAVLSETYKPAQVFSESATSNSESQVPSSLSSRREQNESGSVKTSFSSSKETAASTSFPTSSKSSEESGEFVNIPQIMEERIKEHFNVYGKRLDFESMRKIIEQGYTQLSSIRKKVTRKEYVLDDLNQVIDDLQKLCQAICVTIPEKYLMTDSDSKSSLSESKH